MRKSRLLWVASIGIFAGGVLDFLRNLPAISPDSGAQWALAHSAEAHLILAAPLVALVVAAFAMTEEALGDQAHGEAVENHKGEVQGK